MDVTELDPDALGFNSRSREGSDSSISQRSRGDLCFNSRSREGSDAAANKANILAQQFQFTLPRGERRMTETPNWDATKFQFTLPRGERHILILLIGNIVIVSIHAPARGATHPYTPHRKHCHSFNSRSREGSDEAQAEVDNIETVSIHAPARGATSRMHVLRTSSTVFQFTLPRGERHYKKAVARLEIEFQFTLPRGERRVAP